MNRVNFILVPTYLFIAKPILYWDIDTAILLISFFVGLWGESHNLHHFGPWDQQVIALKVSHLVSNNHIFISDSIALQIIFTQTENDTLSQHKMHELSVCLATTHTTPLFHSIKHISNKTRFKDNIFTNKSLYKNHLTDYT